MQLNAAVLVKGTAINPIAIRSLGSGEEPGAGSGRRAIGGVREAIRIRMS